MKKTKSSTHDNNAAKANEKKVTKSQLDDKDEKVQKHRATDIQKPSANKA